MIMTSLMIRLKQSIAEFWTARDARERAALHIGAAAVAASLFYALLIDPALTGREQLNRSLPNLRQQAAQMQALAKEAAGLSIKSAQVAISEESINAALARKGLKPQSVMLNGEIVRVQLTSAPFAGMLEWLDDMQKNEMVSVVDANIAAIDQPGLVNATLMLRQSLSE